MRGASPLPYRSFSLYLCDAGTVQKVPDARRAEHAQRRVLGCTQASTRRTNNADGALSTVPTYRFIHGGEEFGGVWYYLLVNIEGGVVVAAAEGGAEEGD